MFRQPLRRVVARAVNWNKLQKHVEGHEELTMAVRSVQSAIAEIQRDADTVTDDVAPIDWDHYEDNIRRAEFVEKLQEEYDGMVMPDFSDALLPKLESVLTEELTHIKGAEDFIKEELEAAERELAFVRDASLSKDMTAEDVFHILPEVQDDLEEMVLNEEWEKINQE